MARRLIKEEGLFCGGSSGTAMVGALIAARELKKGQRCVVLLPDSVRNYMTKFLSDDWMKSMGFMDEISIKREVMQKEQWCGAKIKDLNLPCALSIPKSTTNKEAIDIMKEKGFDQLPVVTDLESGHLEGIF